MTIGEAIRLDPEYHFAYANRGMIKDALGQHEAAIEDYNEALRLKPDNAQAYTHRGIAKEKLGQREEAIADFEEAITRFNEVIRLNPSSATTY